MRLMLTHFRTRLANSGLFPNGEWVLLLALMAEVALFSAIAPGFFTLGNFFEVLRFSVELGLLTVAMTPIIIAGGIDLSVGSTVGIAAVVFGSIWGNGHLPIWLAVLVTLLVGCASGALNALMIAGLRLPALIVTLGTYSLYRGIAEGMTQGAVSYTGFPKTFLALGQGYLWGVIPMQLPIFLLVIFGYVLLVHRSVIGRALYAIGFNLEGALYAGLPVRRYEALIYLLSGIVSSLAAIIYVAHLGLAKSDMGTGYELEAIAAVVLGGASVFGGRGTLLGSMLGLFFLTVLQNGMHLLAMPSELTGVLIGTLLLAIVSFDRLRTMTVRGRKPVAYLAGWMEHAKERRLITVGSGIILGLLLVVSTIWIVRSVKTSGAARVKSAAGEPHRPVIAVMPKAKGDPYFISARVGA